MRPFFADLHVIRGAHESLSQGLDPYVQNPNDPWKRLYNYPPVAMYVLGSWLTADNIWVVGIILIALFYAITFKFIGRIDYKQGIYYGLILFSPVIFLLLERGNLDILIYILLLIGIIYSVQVTNNKNKIIWGMVYCCSLLKLYPIISIFSLLGRKESFIKPFAIIGALFLGYLIFISGYLELIADNTPKAALRSYGSAILPDILSKIVKQFNPTKSVITFEQLMIVGNSCLLVFLAIIFITTRKQTAMTVNTETPQLIAFRIGGLIYLGSFALGSNWDYRLVFLLFTIPQLFEWLRNDAFNKSFIFSILTAIFLIMN